MPETEAQLDDGVTPPDPGVRRRMPRPPIAPPRGRRWAGRHLTVIDAGTGEEGAPAPPPPGVRHVRLPRNRLLVCDDRLRRRVHATFHRPMIVLALLILPLLAVEFLFLQDRAAARGSFLWWSATIGFFVIWLAFLVEFTVKIAIAESRVEYVKRNWLDVIIILVPVLRPLRVASLAKTSRVFTLRGVGMKLARYLFTIVVGFEATERLMERLGVKRDERRATERMTRRQLAREVRRSRRELDAWEDWYRRYRAWHVERGEAWDAELPARLGRPAHLLPEDRATDAADAARAGAATATASRSGAGTAPSSLKDAPPAANGARPSTPPAPSVPRSAFPTADHAPPVSRTTPTVPRSSVGDGSAAASAADGSVAASPPPIVPRHPVDTRLDIVVGRSVVWPEDPEPGMIGAPRRPAAEPADGAPEEPADAEGGDANAAGRDPAVPGDGRVVLPTPRPPLAEVARDRGAKGWRI